MPAPCHSPGHSWFQHSRAGGMGSELGFNPPSPGGMLWGGIRQEEQLLFPSFRVTPCPGPPGQGTLGSAGGLPPSPVPGWGSARVLRAWRGSRLLLNYSWPGLADGAGAP